MADHPIHVLASEAVTDNRAALAAGLVEREFAEHPELTERYGTGARAHSQQDALHHLSFLAQALRLNNQALFTDYIAWARVVLVQRNVQSEDLAFHLDRLAEVLRDQLPGALGNLAAECVDTAVRAIPTMPDDLPTFLQDGAPLSPLAHQYFEALRRGERHVASALILGAVAAGTPVKGIYLHVFQPAQHEIGRLWQTNRITVAQEHYCTAATQLIMSQLYSHVFSSAKNGRTLVATCVSGDLHEIGIRMVSDFFEMAGWNTYFLGASTPHSSVVATLREHNADILAVSATMSYHVDAVRELIAAVRGDPGVGTVPILAGGYPFSKDRGLWRVVGADGFASDAQAAIRSAEQLLDGRAA